jgi:hypothetical protein
MAAQTGAGAQLTGAWHLPRRHSRHDRRRRQIRPVVEPLEGRLVLAVTSPTNPMPIGPEPDGTSNPGPAGVAYQQIVAVQTTTLQSLGDSYREVQAAGAQFASRAVVAIDQLNAVLRESRHEANAIAAAIGRDRDLLDLGGADTAREEQGLDVARGLADQQANTDEIYIPNHLYTSLAQLVQQDQSTGTAISRSGRRSEKALVRELNKLGDQLTSTITVRTSLRN